MQIDLAPAGKVLETERFHLAKPTVNAHVNAAAQWETIMPARDMAKYMRERRARQKAEREAARASEPVVDASIPRNAIMSASDAEMATVRAKLKSIGPGAVITKTNGRLDVLPRAAFEARENAVAKLPALRSASPPKSMLAVGGTAGKGRAVAGYDPAFAPLDPQGVSIRLNQIEMLRALSIEADQARAERRALETRVAALEAKAATPSIVDALAGFARAALGRR
jgi:hypothetical protein